MFTGIIQGIGTVAAVEQLQASCRLCVNGAAPAAQIQPGDSVGVDGVCLTASSVTGEEMVFDVGAETLSRTTLGQFRPGRQSNLEPALRVGDRLGGHFVSGHVDGTGTIRAARDLPGQVRLHVAVAPELTDNMIIKGSVAVDGVSLTIAGLDADGFEVSLIPHTLRATTLQYRRAGDRVNIECDMIGRWIRALLGNAGDLAERPRLDVEQLREQGF